MVPHPTSRQLVTIFKLLADPETTDLPRSERVDARRAGFIDPIGVTHTGRTRFFLAGEKAVERALEEARIGVGEIRIRQVFDDNTRELERVGLMKPSWRAQATRARRQEVVPPPRTTPPQGSLKGRRRGV